jgi:hypothetical protein
MEPLVLQLQAECLDSRVSILEVLRKALVVARKLSLTDAQVWIEKELKGYKTGDSAPLHRFLTGQIRAWNPYHGCWIPVVFQDSREADNLSQFFVVQPVGELEDLVRNCTGTVQFPFSSEAERYLMKGMGVPLQATRHVSRAAVGGILDAVRNMVLELCLQLEKDGILGEGLVFSAKEKEVAAQANYTINYNAPVAHSQIQQGSPHATQTMIISETDNKAIADFVGTLKEHVAELKLDASAAMKLNTEVQQIETQVASANPDRTVLGESLRTIRNVLEGCAGSLIASGLLF